MRIALFIQLLILAACTTHSNTIRVKGRGPNGDFDLHTDITIKRTKSLEEHNEKSRGVIAAVAKLRTPYAGITGVRIEWSPDEIVYGVSSVLREGGPVRFYLITEEPASAIPRNLSHGQNLYYMVEGHAIFRLRGDLVLASFEHLNYRTGPTDVPMFQVDAASLEAPLPR